MTWMSQWLRGRLARRAAHGAVVKRVSPRFWRKVGFLVLINLILLGGAELAAWLGSPPYYVPVVRQEHLGRAKRPGEKRLFVYGESTVYGFPYGPANSTAHWLELILRDVLPSEPVRVINFGRPARGSYHLRDALERTLCYQPDAVVLCIGHNEFLPYSHQFVEHPVHRRCYFASHVYRILHEGLCRWQSRRDFARPFIGIPAGSPLHERIVRTYAANIEAMLAAAQHERVPVLLCVPACNLAGQAPRQSQHDESVAPEARSRCEALLAEAERAFQEGRDTVDLAEQMLTCSRHYALGHYLRGRGLALRGACADAYTAYGRARDLDALPFRCKEEQAAVLRELSVRFEVPLIDLPAVFRRAAGGQAPGRDLFVDACHPRPLGQYLMAEAIARSLCARGDFAAADAWQWDNLPSYEQCARQIYSPDQWREQEQQTLWKLVVVDPPQALEVAPYPPPLAANPDPEWTALYALAACRHHLPTRAREAWRRLDPTQQDEAQRSVAGWPEPLRRSWQEIQGSLAPESH